MAVAATSESLEWRQARQWLITSEVIPVTHRVTKPDVDLVDFARSLRDGVFLCSLLNKLKPGSVSDSDWTPKPLMQVYCNVNVVWYSKHLLPPVLNYHLAIISVGGRECSLVAVSH